MNDEKMILPANYQCINTEEMEHIYGGEYKSVVTTLSSAFIWNTPVVMGILCGVVGIVIDHYCL